jgi:hypothetical protein
MTRPQPQHYHSHAGRVAIASLVDELRTALLRAHRSLPNAPSDAYVAQLRRDINRQEPRRTACEQILRILLTDLLDGAPLDDVLEFPRLLITILEAHATPVPSRSIDALLDGLSRRETELEMPVNCAQLRRARDKSPQALRDMEQTLTEYDDVQDELLAQVRRALYATTEAVVARGAA